MVGATQHKAKPSSGKPGKPRSDFPLFPHARGYWAKKIRGRLVYFGKLADDLDGKAALEKWLDQRDDLLAGRTPRVHREGLTLKDLCNTFLTAKKKLVDTSELSPRTFADYLATCQRLCDVLGKRRFVDDLAADDFEGLRAGFGKTLGPVAVGNEVNRVRVVFKYGHDAGLLDQPVRYGPHFKHPSRRTLRHARAAKGPRMLEAKEIRTVLDKASPTLYAMILLGINCGLGNADVGLLESRHMDLKGGWLNYPRPKTGIDRRAKLWPETVTAIRSALEKRLESKEKRHEDLVFVTRTGDCWAKDVADSPVSKEFSKLLVDAGLKRPGVSFYALRHTLETIGGESKDQVAVNAIMGHIDATMAGVYRERISDERLKAVTDHVRMWLFAAKKSPRNKSK